jgi:hypothetical protein
MSSSESASGVGIGGAHLNAGAPRSRREGGDFKRLHRARAIIATTFLGLDDTIDFAKSRRQRSQDHVACFLHLRDLVYLTLNGVGERRMGRSDD